MRSATAALLLLLASSTMLAQSTPPPPTPFPAPITAYDGRYLDSAQTLDFQFPDRTLRSYKAKAAPELNLMLMSFSGSAFAAYDLGTLPSRLASSPVRSTGAHGEKYLPPDVFFDAQASGSGFVFTPMDGQIFLRDFDYDDRGDFYLAYGAWGFALLDHTGHLLSQVISPPVSPQVTLSVRVGGTYYALVSDGTSTTAVYDVTNAASPAFVRMLPFGTVAYAKSLIHVAVATNSGTLRISTPSALVAGTLPLQVLPPGFDPFIDVTTDGTIFYTLSFGSVGTVVPQGGIYVLTRMPLGASGKSIRYGAGYLGVTTVPKGLILFSVGSSGLTRTDLSSFVTAAYPGPFVIPGSAVPFNSGASTQLLLAYAAIGDVFQLAAATPVPALSPLVLVFVGIAMAVVAAFKLR